MPRLKHSLFRKCSFRKTPSGKGLRPNPGSHPQPSPGLRAVSCLLPLLLLWVAIVAAGRMTVAHAAQDASSSTSTAIVTSTATSTEQGVFSILAGNRKIGTETFQIVSTASGYEATGEISLKVPGGPSLTEGSTLRVDQNLQPILYDRSQKAPQQGSVTVRFGSPETMLVSETEEGSQNRIFYLPETDLVVLDTNFFHHYTFLLRRYDDSQSGSQHFNVFIPQEATPGTISLSFQGRENQTAGGVTADLNHYQVVTDQLTMEIWASPDARIHRITIPQADLEIVREEME